MLAAASASKPEVGTYAPLQPKAAAVTRVQWAAMAGVVLAAVSLLLGATRWGLDLTTDSPMYVASARNLLRGYGLGWFDAQGVFQHTTHFPPLYPMLLALSSDACGCDVLTSARWLHVLLFGATVALVFITVARHSGPSVLAPCVVVLFMIAGGAVLVWFGSAQTEAPFIFSTLVGLVLLSVYLEHPRAWLLLASGVALAAALLTRYAGVPAIAAAIVLLLAMAGPRSLRQRLTAAGVLGTISSLPLALWLLSEGQTGLLAPAATAAGMMVPDGPVVASRDLGVHVITIDQLKYGPMTVARWMLPEGVLRGGAAWAEGVWPSLNTPERLALSVLLVACGGAASLLLRGLIVQVGAIARRRPLPAATRLGLTFAVMYVGFLAVTMSVAYPSTEYSLRTLVPVYITLVMLLPSTFEALRPGQRIFVGVCLGLIAVGNIAQTASWVRQGFQDGLDFGSRLFSESLLIDRVQSLPTDTYVFTNAPEVMSLYTGWLHMDHLPPTAKAADADRPALGCS
jgi:4-amino-4-deoxy-L-arabinose transferase-like glycosyltransferase